MNRQQPDLADVWLAALLIVAVLACAHAIAAGQVTTLRATSALGERRDDALWAARACYVEAGFGRADCVAILHVARKRAERVQGNWLDVLRRYSAVDARNARARAVRRWPWGDVPGKGEAFNALWAQLRELVTETLAGEHEDPCPRAIGWGGPMDPVRAGQRPVRCKVRTRNWFYAAVGR